MLSDALTLDIARAGDRPALTGLARSLHALNEAPLEPSLAAQIVPMLVVDGHRLRVARLGASLAAYALWRERRQSLYVRHFVVAPELRGVGVGRAFLGLLLGHWPLGKDVCLHARRPAARRFWLANGFRPAADGLRLSRKPENAR